MEFLKNQYILSMIMIKADSFSYTVIGYPTNITRIMFLIDTTCFSCTRGTKNVCNF